jgi:phage terminase large subunit-like protein
VPSSSSEAPPILRPLSGPRPLGKNARTEGWAVIAWIESHCTYGDGDKHGEPVRLEPFQKWLLLHLYELLPSGTRRYRRALLEFPKGNGKTPLNAWVGLYELWHRRSPNIPVGATAYAQAELLFGDMRACVDSSDKLQTRLEAFEDRILHKDGSGKAYKVAAKGGSNDGGRPTTYCADEIHEMLTAEQVKAYRNIARGVKKRSDGFELATTTPGADLDSLLGKLHVKGLKTNAGEPGGDPRLLFVWYGAGPEFTDLDDPAVLAAALRASNPAADLFLNVEEHVASFGDMPLYEFERYHLGRWTQVLAAWLPPGAWADRIDKERAKTRTNTAPGIPAGADVVLGFDGSFSGDSTALVACDLNGMVLGVVACWEKPENARPDWHVPMADVVGAVRQACTTYRVREIAYDPRIWQQAFQELEAEGLPVVEFDQGAPMLKATQRLYEAVARGEVSHDGDPRLTRHMGNCVGTQVAGGVRVGKETRSSTRWVDLAIAAAMAFMTACVLTDKPGVQMFDPDDLDLDLDADWLDDL